MLKVRVKLQPLGEFLLSLLSSRTLANIEDSDVYQMLQKEQEEPPAPRQSGSFKALQDFIESDGEITTDWCHTANAAAPTITVRPPVSFSASLCGQARVPLGPGR